MRQLKNPLSHSGEGDALTLSFPHFFAGGTSPIIFRVPHLNALRRKTVLSSTGFSLCGFGFHPGGKAHRLKSVPLKPDIRELDLFRQRWFRRYLLPWG